MGRYDRGLEVEMLYDSILDDLLTHRVKDLNSLLGTKFNNVLDFIAMASATRL